MKILLFSYIFLAYSAVQGQMLSELLQIAILDLSNEIKALRDEIKEYAKKEEFIEILNKSLTAMMTELKAEVEEMISGAKSEWETQNNNTRSEIATLMHLLDTDECQEMTHNCSSDASCIDTSVSFRCQCKPGFTGDGYTCNDIDECTENRCDPRASCTNSLGEYSCSCNAGFEGPGENCTDIDPITCDSPFTAVRGVGCIHIIEKSQSHESSRDSCKEIGGDLFVAINPVHYLRLAEHFIDTNQAATKKYMWVGVKEGVWLNGRKVVPEEEAPKNPTMGNGTCSYTDGDLSEKFLLWTDPCSTGW